MTPYYQDELVTIWHGDCRDLLPSIEADVIVTDPPYGIGATYRAHGGSGGDVLAWDAEYPHSVINEAVTRGPVVSFGAAQMIARELAAFEVTPRLAIWAPSFRLGMSAKDHMAYRYTPVYLWGVAPKEGTVRDVFTEPTEAGNRWVHPASKPVRLMIALCALTSGTILDPFMGSGTTLVAAKSLNRHAIGIEIDERYCEIAATRCSQGVLGLEMA